MMDWIREKLLALFGPKYIASLARHIATALAGVLGSYGVTNGALEEVITGVLLFLLSLALSFFDKAKNQPKDALPPAKQ